MEKIIIINKVKNPVISIIIPTLNEEKYIERTLLSLKRQDLKLPYEIIVSDSNSKDKTVEIAKKYADIIIITDKRGVSIGRNLGAKIARGKYLLFLDADTMLLPNSLREIYNFLGTTKYIGVNVPILSDDIKYCFHYLIATLLYLLLTKINAQPIYAVCFACKRKYFLKVGGFDERLNVAEDIELGQRLKKIGKIGYLTTTYAITSVRRLKKWGSLKVLIIWLLGYFLIKFFKRQPRYDPVR